MAKQTLIRWLSLLKDRPYIFKPSDLDIHVISDCQSEEFSPPLLRKYFPKIDTKKTLKDFSFYDIFFRSVRFAGRPDKKNLSSRDRFKRTLIRFFHNDYERTANIWNLVDTVFLPSSRNSMFISSAHIVDMFRVHFPDFDVFELSGHTNSFRNMVIYMLALVSRSRFTEDSEGITIFANLANPFLLKAYKLLHPNKKVFLRFHDRIDQIAKRTSTEKLRKTLQKLREKNIIHEAESYYEADANLLNISYRPNAVNSEVMRKVDNNSRHYFYTFIGTYKSKLDHSRLNSLKKIRERLCVLYPSALQYINEHIMVDLNNERIDYTNYLKIVGLSEIIVDMYRIAPDEGLSFRIPEALLLERKIITNRLIVLECDFYHPSRFFVIGHDSLDRLKEFVESDFRPLPPEVRNRYDCRNWWRPS